MKKLVSLLLALLMVLSLTTVAIVSVGAASTKIYFEVPKTDDSKWGAATAKNSYYCYIWDPLTGKALNGFQAKNGKCEIESDYLVSYDPDVKIKGKMLEGVTYGVIFVNTKNTQTFDGYFDRTCLGDTAYVDTTQVFVNPVDSTKTGNPVYFKNSTAGGPARGITNMGVVQGTAYIKGQTDVDLFKSFMTPDATTGKSNYDNALALSDYKTCQELIEYVYSQLQDVTYEDLKPYLPAEFVIPAEPTEPPTEPPTDPPTEEPTPAPTEPSTPAPTDPEPTERPTDPIVSDYYVVAGDAALFGSNWDPADRNNELLLNSETGIYEKTYSNVAAGSYNFKVTTNGAWDIGDYNLEGDAKFGGKNAVAEVAYDNSTVVIGFDGTKALLTIIPPADAPTTPTEVKPTTATEPEDPTAPMYVTKRYYFVMPNEWYNEMTSGAGIYWWDGAVTTGAWPGIDAQETDIPGVFYCDVPADTTTIIWNNRVDGGMDETAPGYGKNAQSVNIGAESYDIGESDNYPDGCDNFNGMIWVVDKNQVSVNDFSGAPTCGGEWFYYNPETGECSLPNGTKFNVRDRRTYEFTSSEPTTPVPTEPIAKTSINVGGKNYPVTVGDEVTYTYYLNVQGLLENIEARVSFDPTKLQFIPDFTYDEDLEENVLDTSKMFPQISKAGGLVFNYPGMSAGSSIGDNEIRFNSSVLAGIAFKKDDAVLVRFRFKVIADGESDIDMFIANATYKEGAPVVRDGEVMVDTFYSLETLDTPVQPTEPPTQPEPTQPEPTQPEPTQPEPTQPEPTQPEPTQPEPTQPEPTQPEPTEEPTQPEPTEVPTEVAPTEIAPTDAPAPTVAPTNSAASADQKPTDAKSTNGGASNNAVVKTGTTQFAVVFLVVLVMAAGVIVFARKKTYNK